MEGSEQAEPRIYTAGALRDDGEYTEWRRSVEDALVDLTFYHPEGFKAEHGGMSISGAVSEDMAAIQAADGVVAYISERPQVGTITEVLHAVHTDTPTLVVFDDDTSLISGPTSYADDYELQELRYPVEVEPLNLLASARDHWFFINYLVGDTEPVSYQPGHVDGVLPRMIKEWPGIRGATVMAIPNEEDLTPAVHGWIEDTFDYDAATQF